MIEITKKSSQRWNVPQLNFPEKYQFRVKEEAGKPKIFCSIRKKYVPLTPEEWVRQHVLALLQKNLGFPKVQTTVEKKIKGMQATNRLDVLVYTKENPFLIVECKAPDIPLSTATIHQAQRYNNQLKAPFIFVSNGQKHILLEETNDGKLVSRSYAEMQTKWNETLKK